jgi:hypothetical protein
MEENLHITKRTHQQQQRTTVSRDEKKSTKENIEETDEKFNMQSTKTTVHLFFCMHKMSSL